MDQLSPAIMHFLYSSQPERFFEIAAFSESFSMGTCKCEAAIPIFHHAKRCCNHHLCIACCACYANDFIAENGGMLGGDGEEASEKEPSAPVKAGGAGSGDSAAADDAAERDYMDTYDDGGMNADRDLDELNDMGNDSTSATAATTDAAATMKESALLNSYYTLLEQRIQRDQGDYYSGFLAHRGAGNSVQTFFVVRDYVLLNDKGSKVGCIDDATCVRLSDVSMKDTCLY